MKTAEKDLANTGKTIWIIEDKAANTRSDGLYSS
jgi:hypothetical protein